MFIGHRLLQNDSVLILYLEPQLTEYALDFLKKTPQKKSKERDCIENGIYDYIYKNLPNIKIGAVKVMLGSMLVASFSFAPTGPSYAQSMTNIYQNQIHTSYNVISGDTLYAISEKFNTSISRLKQINNLSSDMIYVDQQLKIISDKLYTIKFGDTLYTISQKFGTTVSHIKQLNNLTSDMIYGGQKLKVIDFYQGIYTVKSGDTLFKIAYMYNTQVSILKDINFLTDNMIYVGQSLYIPSHFITPNPENSLVLVNKKYALPSNYIPPDLLVPNIPFTFKEYDQKKLLRKGAASAIGQLFNQAKNDGIQLFGLSGYRSYERQDTIFTSNVQRSGLKVANQFSAKPGESEHQTGLAMDVTAPSVNYGLSQAFGETIEGKWLKANAPKFGFIIRYPEGKEAITGYQYEPWHIRYVGLNASKEIDERNITLEEYI